MQDFSESGFHARNWASPLSAHQQNISADQAILFGKPVIAGTRIPVDLILGRLGYGDSMESLLEDYPKLQREDIACNNQFLKEEIC